MRAEIVIDNTPAVIELTGVTAEQADAWVDGAAVDHTNGTARTWIPAARVVHGVFLPDA